MEKSSTTNRKITFCITEMDVGGAEKAMVRVAIGLKKKDWDVRVISLRDAGKMSEPLTAAGIPVTPLNCGSFADLRAWFRLVKELRRHKPNVLCSFLHQANIYGRLAGRWAKVPIIVSGIRVADRRRWVVATDRMTQCCSDHYVAVSQQVGRLHARLCHVSASKMTAIPNGVDISDGPANNDSVNDRFRLLFVGRLTKQKAPIDLFEAYLRLPDDLKARTILTYAGEGELRPALERLIEENDLKSQVILVGQSDDVPELMRQSTLLVLPSLWEGMPNVVLEAMAASLPVIATGTDGTSELIQNEVNGWLVPPGDPASLSTTIHAALNDEPKRLRFARKSQRIAADQFSWQSTIDAFDSLLRQLSD